MKIFHYANIDDWEEMKHRYETMGESVCLRASRRVGKEFAEAWNTGAVFGLLSPTPENWTGNEAFTLTWDALTHDLGGRLLLEIDVDPEKDRDVFVVDRGYMEGFLHKDVENANIPKKYDFQNRHDAEKAYIESKVSLKEFIEEEPSHAFSLPEVMITDDIPMNRLSVSSEQPLLERELKCKDCEYKRNFVKRLREIPELDAWYQRRMKESEPQESSMVMKHLR